MKYSPLYYLLALFAIIACHSTEKKKPDTSNAARILKETLATGDTAMIALSGFKKKDIRDVLCQHWEIRKGGGTNSLELTRDENGNAINPELNLFKDGSVLENPRHHIGIGTWQLVSQDTLVLNLGKIQKKYTIASVHSQSLRLITKGKSGDNLYLSLGSDALVHSNMINDPFHPSNNQWRIRPTAPESDSAIKQRVKDCIRFYALFYRDNLKRPDKTSINFAGLPAIFNWYSGGIGIPPRQEVDSSWINCFYNKAQALRGYDMMERLIVDYEYEWPKQTAWSSQTHFVLEQMYHKANVK